MDCWVTSAPHDGPMNVAETSDAVDAVRLREGVGDVVRLRLGQLVGLHADRVVADHADVRDGARARRW